MNLEEERGFNDGTDEEDGGTDDDTASTGSVVKKASLGGETPTEALISEDVSLEQIQYQPAKSFPC